MINIDLIAGARPNFIKIASLTHALKKYDDIKIRLVHTGQHYDKKMSKDLNKVRQEYFANIVIKALSVKKCKIGKSLIDKLENDNLRKVWKVNYLNC